MIRTFPFSFRTFLPPSNPETRTLTLSCDVEKLVDGFLLNNSSYFTNDKVVSLYITTSSLTLPHSFLTTSATSSDMPVGRYSRGRGRDHNSFSILGTQPTTERMPTSSGGMRHSIHSLPAILDPLQSSHICLFFTFTFTFTFSLHPPSSSYSCFFHGYNSVFRTPDLRHIQPIHTAANQPR